MARVIGFLPIHYGVEYLPQCLMSIKAHVEKMHISYSRNPSHSFQSGEVCPDKEEDILKICQEVLGDKLIWDSTHSFPNEASHREQRFKYADGMDIILSIDADEVFVGVPEAIEYAMSHPERHFGLTGYVNFWRNFNWCNRDGFRPIRLEKIRSDNQLQNIECPMTVYHFSTCQREAVMRYKNKVFGHASEIRPNWFEEVYLAWNPETNIPQHLHPVSLGVWGSAEPFDKNTLPEMLKNHPNFNKERI